MPCHAAQGARGIKQVDRLFESFRIFSTHTEKRDLVVSGAAAVSFILARSVIYLERFRASHRPN